MVVEKCAAGTSAGEVFKLLENQDRNKGGESGFEAYKRIDKLYNEKRNIDILSLRAKIRAPTTPKKESEVLKHIEDWDCNQRLLRQMDPELGTLGKKCLLVPFQEALGRQNPRRNAECRNAMEDGVPY